MFSNLLKFEWLFINRKKMFYAMLCCYIAMGVFIGKAATFSFPNTLQNGTYILNYLIGIVSLLCIFSTTLLAAQTLFREKDANFEAILYATPVRKAPYVISRFTIIFCISTLCYLLFMCGLMAGHVLGANDANKFGPFKWINYVNPFIILLLPNILFCTAVACSISLLTKNKMLVYVSGIFIYFLYWGVSFFTNSPLIANSTPLSADAMKWAAITDPFGMAGFFEQTYYWTALQRNNQLLQLRGHLLANRLLYAGVSIVLLLIAYYKFTFTMQQDKRKDKKTIESGIIASVIYKPIITNTTTCSYNLKSLWSLVKIECRNIIKNIPIWIICLGWMGFLSIEIYSNIIGNSRVPEQFASTGVMIASILSDLPLVALLVLLFYGNEIFWRSKNVRFDALENSTAVKPVVLFIAKWLSLAFIILLLLAASIITAICIQLSKTYTIIDWELYASLFYLTGLPLLLCAGLILSIQVLIKNKYTGIAVAGIIIILTNTSLGSIIGIRHPLLKFANTFQGRYSEMNGFGRNLTAFNYAMVYWLGITFFIFMLLIKLKFKNGASKIKLFSAGNSIMALSLAGSVFGGFTIFNQTKILTKDEVNNWKQLYEEKYTFLKNKPQPTVTDIKTTIDLYPANEGYKVIGVYTLVNKSASAIDTMYIYGDKEMIWGKWQLNNGQLIQSDTQYGYYIFKMQSVLQPGDSIRLAFNFEYKGSPFNAAASFNTIIKNGSFIRISNYFPKPGYNTENDIQEAQERKRRNMLPNNNLLLLEAPKNNEYDFVNLDAIIGTDAAQTAIGIGKLKKQWKKGSRSYYQYTNDSIPFRFALASAKYSIRKIKHNNIIIEAYYHPGHYKNINHLITTAVQALDYCEANFGSYPYPTAQFVEISSFTKGFAGTAYPGALFINESFGYQNKIDANPERDILNEMVSHELSHTWWGNAKIAPDYREGNLLMTETLAMYTELMVYKKVYGDTYLLDRVNVHKDIYLSSRSAADEEPLYKLNPDKPYLAYDKGMTVMYELYKLLGEEKINGALKNFYNKFSYPQTRPVATDLLDELYAMASPEVVPKINELLKQIITYDVIVDNAIAKKNTDGTYNLAVHARINKYNENSKGKSVFMLYNDTVAATIYFNDNTTQKVTLKIINNKIQTTVALLKKPVTVVINSDGMLLNRAAETAIRKVVHQ